MKKLFLVLAVLLLAASPAAASHGGKHVFVKINGLVCDFCAQSMKKVFGKKEPVAGVDVDLTAKLLTLSLKNGGNLSDDDITKGIVDAGYAVVEIKRD